MGKEENRNGNTKNMIHSTDYRVFIVRVYDLFQLNFSRHTKH